jgi:hypothetical protein
LLARLSRERLVALIVLALAFGLITVAFWPGRVNLDSLGQIDEVESGAFTNLHAPLLQALWSPLWDLGIEVGAALMLQVLAFLIGAYLILRAAFRPPGAAAAAALIALSPPVLGNLGSIMRDSWYLAALVLAFGLAVRAAQRPWPAQAWYLVLALAAAWSALAARQNAAAGVVLVCIAIAALYLAHRRQERVAGSRPGGERRWRRVGAAVIAGVALTLAMMGTHLAASAAIGVDDVAPESTLLIYDIGAISEREDENLFPPALMPERDLSLVEEAFTVDSMLGFVVAPPNPLGETTGYPRVRDSAAEMLRESWWEAVREYPGAYLDTRVTLWLRQIGITRSAFSVFPPELPGNAGFGVGVQWLYDDAMGYLRFFTDGDQIGFAEIENGTLIHAPWLYLLVAALGAALLLRPTRPAALVVIGLFAASALTFQLGLFFGAMGTRFRFEYPCVATGMLVGAVLLRLAWARWRESRDAAAREPDRVAPARPEAPAPLG